MMVVMGSYGRLLLLWLILSHLTMSTTSSNIFVLEMEDYVSDRSPNARTEASGNKSVTLRAGDYLKVYFCLRTETNILIKDVFISNDGDPDLISVTMDGTVVGVIQSQTHKIRGKANWEDFRSNGKVGQSLRLPSGYHVIGLNVSKANDFSVSSSDNHGVEIDAIVLETDDKYLEEGVFRCSLYCVPGILFDNGPIDDQIPSIVLQRKMYDLQCLTEDNVVFPMFHPNPSAYVITSMLPKYRSFENQAESPFEGCVLPSNVVFKFENFNLPLSTRNDLDPSHPATLSYRKSRLTHAEVLNVTFFPQNMDINSTSHHVLSIEFGNVIYPFTVQIRYKGKYEWSDYLAKYFTHLTRSEIWTIPAGTWDTVNPSYVEIDILTNPATPNSLFVKHLTLTRKTFQEKNRKSLHQSQSVKIETVSKPYERQNGINNKMKVRNMDKDMNTHDEVDYISLYHVLPWSQDYSEVMRLHHTGKLELLPLAPPGLKQVPFGSSFVVGQVDPDLKQPRAPIREMDVHPENLTFDVYYHDGGFSTLVFKPSLYNTQVVVKGIRFTRPTDQLAFVALTSMWLNDGNSEMDHVSTNGNNVRHVVNGWQKMYGTTFSFMKKCISKFNTQGPDMTLKIIAESDLYKYV